MTKSELEKFKTALEKKQAEISANLRNREDITHVVRLPAPAPARRSPFLQSSG